MILPVPQHRLRLAAFLPIGRPLALAWALAILPGLAFADSRASVAVTRPQHLGQGRAPAHKKPVVAGKPSKRGKPVSSKSGRSGKRASHKGVLVERHVAATKAGLPNVQALGALVLDESGHELYARNADAERPIASISKLAATLAVMDHGLELEGLSTISKLDLEVARGGARSRLLEGTTLSNRDLLHAALMGSDNRAIPALGRAVKLTPSQLAAAMTAKAKELGLKHTRFHDPTGLSVENVSTPRETIAMLQAVMRHPVLGPITRRVEYQAHPVGRPPITYLNTYRPAIRGNVEVLGGKTGYNDDARYCLVLAAKIEGKTCFMSFLSNEGKMTRFGDVARVADWMIARRPKTVVTAAAPSATPAPNNVPLEAAPQPGSPTTAASPPTSTAVATPSAARDPSPRLARAKVRTPNTTASATNTQTPSAQTPSAQTASAPPTAPNEPASEGVGAMSSPEEGPAAQDSSSLSSQLGQVPFEQNEPVR